MHYFLYKEKNSSLTGTGTVSMSGLVSLNLLKIGDKCAQIAPGSCLVFPEIIQKDKGLVFFLYNIPVWKLTWFLEAPKCIPWTSDSSLQAQFSEKSTWTRHSFNLIYKWSFSDFSCSYWCLLLKRYLQTLELNNLFISSNRFSKVKNTFSFTVTCTLNFFFSPLGFTVSFSSCLFFLVYTFDIILTFKLYLRFLAFLTLSVHAFFCDMTATNLLTQFSHWLFAHHVLH